MIIGTTEEGSYTVVEAEVPLSEMFGYSTALRSLTQGKAEFTMEFASFKAVPKSVSEELVKPKVEINKPVRWVKKITAPDRVINLKVDIEQLQEVIHNIKKSFQVEPFYRVLLSVKRFSQTKLWSNIYYLGFVWQLVP